MVPVYGIGVWSGGLGGAIDHGTFVQFYQKQCLSFADQAGLREYKLLGGPVPLARLSP